jgi:pteridine reductase
MDYNAKYYMKVNFMPKKTNSSPKVALITGAARRIGAEIVRFLHAKGFNVVVHYRTSATAAHTLCASLNSERDNSALALQANLLNIATFGKLITKSVKKWGRLDVLVNNASCFQQTKIGKLSAAAWSELINVNLKAPLFLSEAAAPYLAKQKGCIINIADIHGERPMRHYSIYSVSKAGLLMLTQALARELAPAIRVNSISPGPTIWPEGENTLSQAFQKEVINRTLLKRHGDPKMVAKAVYYLINESDDMTGQNLILDGGRSILI